MYPFPQAPFPQSTLVLTLFHAAVFTFFCCAISWLYRKSRSPRNYDILLITILLWVSITFLHSPRRQHLGLADGYIPFIYLVLIIATGAVLLSLHYYLDGKTPSSGLLQRFFILFQCGFFVWVPFIYIGLPEVNGVRSTVNRIHCRSNIRNVGVALNNYAIDHQGDIPPSASGDPPHSWRVDLLPYIERKGYFDRYDKQQKWNVGFNEEIAKTEIDLFWCPENPVTQTEKGYYLTAYAAITGKNALWGEAKSMNFDEAAHADGLSQTLLLVEACGQNIAWSEPRDVDIDELPIGINLPGKEESQSKGIISSYHGGGANVMFADTHIRPLSEHIDPEILKALCTATGGEKLDPDDF